MAAKKGGAGKKSGTGMDKKTLSSMAATWKDVDTPEPGKFGDIPDGKYHAKVESAILDTAGGKDKNRLQVRYAFRIEGPTNANRMAFMQTGLMDAVGIEFSKRALATLELDVPEDIEDLPDVLGKAVGKRVELNLKTKTTDAGTFQNTYMNKCLDGDAAGDTNSEEETVSFVGKTVSFEDDEGNEVQGEVTSQKDDQLSVKDGDGDEWEVAVSDVSLVEEESEESEGEGETEDTGADMVGKTVEFKDEKDKAVTGEVTATDGEGQLTVKVDDEEWEVPADECTVVEKKAPAKIKKKVKKTKKGKK